MFRIGKNYAPAFQTFAATMCFGNTLWFTGPGPGLFYGWMAFWCLMTVSVLLGLIGLLNEPRVKDAIDRLEQDFKRGGGWRDFGEEEVHTMRKLPREWLNWALILGWPIVMLSQIGIRATLEELLKRDFWISFGQVVLLAIASAGAIAGCLYGYYRFCQWFNQTIEGERSRVPERIALREGVLTWPTSDPLHDPELDA